MLIIKVKYEYTYDNNIKILETSVHKSIDDLFLSNDHKSTLRFHNAVFVNSESIFYFIYNKKISESGTLKRFYIKHNIEDRTKKLLRNYKLRNICG